MPVLLALLAVGKVSGICLVVNVLQGVLKGRQNVFLRVGAVIYARVVARTSTYITEVDTPLHCHPHVVAQGAQNFNLIRCGVCVHRH